MSAPAVSTPALPSQGRLVFLDYLRIFAFASVFVGHKFIEPLRAVAQSGSGWQGALARAVFPFVEGGGAGVVVFFLVSGYIITHVLQREHTAEFLLKRAFRIYPLYWAAVLGHQALLWAQQGTRPEPATLLPQLLLIGDVTGTTYTLHGIEWTLRLELAFYLLMAACSASGLTRAARGLALALPFGGLLLALHLLPPLASHTEWSRGYLSLYLPFLLVGSVWWLYEQRRLRGLTLLAFVAAAYLLYRLGLQQWQARWQHTWFAEVALALFALGWWLRARLPAPVLVLALSELTYAVYLLHVWLFEPFRDAALRLGAPPAAGALTGIAGVLAASWLLVRAIERPGIARGRRLARRLEPRLRRA